MRPPIQLAKCIYSLVSKFNSVLESTVADDQHSLLMKIEVQHTGTNFNHAGNLTPMGKIEFWNQFDELLKEFDREKIELLPGKPLLRKPEHTSSSKHNRYKWYHHDQECK